MSPALKAAWGGVVVDGDGRILLRRVAGGFDGYAWTFPKGRPEPGETPEQCALREVLEESGVTAAVVAPLPGSFDGGTTANGYFLMRPLELDGRFDTRETAEVRWVSPAEAAELLALTTNSVGRARDLAVLAAAAEIARVR